MTINHGEPPCADRRAGYCGGRQLETTGYPIGASCIDSSPGPSAQRHIEDHHHRKTCHG